MLKVDQVRALQRSLMLSPYEVKFRVALLLNFQRANANAQNALLKTLEEAPKQVILLLTADSPDNLLPTIASRCEILRLRPVPIEKLQQNLQSRWQYDAEKSALLAHLANGRTGLALRMAADPDLVEKRAAWVDELLRLIPLNIRERFAAAEPLTKNRDQMRLALQAWLSVGRDLLLASNGQESYLTNEDHAADITTLAKKFSGQQLVDLLNSIDHSLEILESNANLKLLLENLLLNIPQIK